MAEPTAALYQFGKWLEDNKPSILTRQSDGTLAIEEIKESSWRGRSIHPILTSAKALTEELRRQELSFPKEARRELAATVSILFKRLHCKTLPAKQQTAPEIKQFKLHLTAALLGVKPEILNAKQNSGFQRFAEVNYLHSKLATFEDHLQVDQAGNICIPYKGSYRPWVEVKSEICDPKSFAMRGQYTLSGGNICFNESGQRRTADEIRQRLSNRQEGDSFGGWIDREVEHRGDMVPCFWSDPSQYDNQKIIEICVWMPSDKPIAFGDHLYLHLIDSDGFMYIPAFYRQPEPKSCPKLVLHALRDQEARHPEEDITNTWDKEKTTVRYPRPSLLKKITFSVEDKQFEQLVSELNRARKERTLRIDAWENCTKLFLRLLNKVGIPFPSPMMPADYLLRNAWTDKVTPALNRSLPAPLSQVISKARKVFDKVWSIATFACPNAIKETVVIGRQMGIGLLLNSVNVLNGRLWRIPPEDISETDSQIMRIWKYTKFSLNPYSLFYTTHPYLVGSLYRKMIEHSREKTKAREPLRDVRFMLPSDLSKYPGQRPVTPSKTWA